MVVQRNAVSKYSLRGSSKGPAEDDLQTQETNPNSTKHPATPEVEIKEEVDMEPMSEDNLQSMSHVEDTLHPKDKQYKMEKAHEPEDWQKTLSDTDFPWKDIAFLVRRETKLPYKSKSCFEQYRSMVKSQDDFVKKVLGEKWFLGK